MSIRDFLRLCVPMIAAVAISDAAVAQQKILRVVPHAEPKVFDPHQSQVNITSMHAAMVYDHLFSWDADMKPRPQMLESYTISPDKLTYAFTLRPGLKFHDGSAVSSRDAVATVKRLLLRDSQIQKLSVVVDRWEIVDERNFKLVLKEPFGFVEMLIGGSNGVSGGIMREKEASTDAFTPIVEIVGSGPFRFVRAEYKPGAKLVWDDCKDNICFTAIHGDKGKTEEAFAKAAHVVKEHLVINRQISKRFGMRLCTMAF